MDTFCNINQTEPKLFKEDLNQIRGFFVYAQAIFCVFGITGNILNLRTLQSPSLQTVPFMYIRSMAVFDLISLTGIMIHFAIEKYNTNLFLMAYLAYFEPALINTFLVAGLYCAFLLTVERYFLLSQPHLMPTRNPRKYAKRKILMVLLFSAFFHIPMMLQRALRVDNGVYSYADNVDFLCIEPNRTAFKSFKSLREGFRFFCVIMMTILNVVIARQLQLTKQRRRRLVSRRCSPQNDTQNQANCSSPDNTKKEYSSLIKSFAEKKLTGLMIAICFIFILGNIPQILVMLLQTEAMEDVFSFQVFRCVANFLEVVNHCLNFYVFCMASSEYTRAFLLNCICIRSILLRFPAVADFLAARRSSSIAASSSMGLTLQNRDYLSMESINNGDPLWVLDENTPELALGDNPNLKGILVTGNRDENRQKKSLTIVNHLAVPYADDNSEGSTYEL